MKQKYLIMFCILSVTGVILSGCKRTNTETESLPEITAAAPTTTPPTTVLDTTLPETSAKLPIERLNEISSTDYPYIGDAPAVGNLLKLVKQLYHIEENCTIELQTTDMPYSLILHFEKAPDNRSMQQMSALLMNLIDNCYSISWDYPLNEAGDREYFYFPMSVAYDHLTTLYFERNGDAVQKLVDLYDELESMDGVYPAKDRVETLDEAVAAAILDYNREVYGGDYEAAGEGHIIMDMEAADRLITVYAMTMYGRYQFQDGNFVKDGGSGAIPVVIKIAREPDGTLVWQHYQMPADGGDHNISIHKLFPEALWERCLSKSEAELELMRAQEQAYAKAYLIEIGRAAVVGDYGDFEHTIHSEVGISVEVSNKLDRVQKYDRNDPAAYAPFWLGNIERLEDGVRYIYEHSYDADKNEICYAKIHYDSGEVVAVTVYDSITGDKKQ